MAPSCSASGAICATRSTAPDARKPRSRHDAVAYRPGPADRPRLAGLPAAGLGGFRATGLDRPALLPRALAHCDEFRPAVELGRVVGQSGGEPDAAVLGLSVGRPSGPAARAGDGALPPGARPDRAIGGGDLSDPEKRDL